MIALAARLAAVRPRALVGAAPLGAQSLESLAAGARVRVARHAPSPIVVGTLVRADSLSLVIMPNRGPSTMTMSRSELRRIDISSGPRPTGEACVRGAPSSVSALDWWRPGWPSGQIANATIA